MGAVAVQAMAKHITKSPPLSDEATVQFVVLFGETCQQPTDSR